MTVLGLHENPSVFIGKYAMKTPSNYPWFHRLEFHGVFMAFGRSKIS